MTPDQPEQRGAARWQGKTAGQPRSGRAAQRQADMTLDLDEATGSSPRLGKRRRGKRLPSLGPNGQPVTMVRSLRIFPGMRW
jgi:hypothetical protein